MESQILTERKSTKEEADNRYSNAVLYPDLPPEGDVYRHVSRYVTPSWTRATWELLQAFVIHFVFLWIHNWYLLPLMALIRMKIFVIFHDLAHSNFYPSTKANQIVGNVVGSTLLVSHYAWQRDHNYHHKHSNNLERKQYSQTAPWTVQQYQKAPIWIQWLYSILYSPLGVLFLAPFFFFYILQRFVGKWYEQALTCLYFALLYYWGGWAKVLFDIGTGFFAGLLGVFLFHVQHTFPGSKRRRPPRWSYYENGMRSSSFLQLPVFLKYFTFGIEYHHIHHLNAKVPGYRLQECHEAAGDLFKDVPRISLLQAVQTLKYSLWDEQNEQYI